jgi:hypothetical protein
MRRRMVHHLDAFVIQVHRLDLRDIGVGGPGAERKRRLLSRGCADAVEHVLVGEYLGCLLAGGDLARIQIDARPRNPLVAADMIRIRAGVDDQANRRLGDLPHLGEHLVGHGRRAGVDQDDAVLSHLHHDVAARAEDRIDGRPDLDRFKCRGTGRTRLSDLRLRGLARRQRHSEDDQPRSLVIDRSFHTRSRSVR